MDNRIVRLSRPAPRAARRLSIALLLAFAGGSLGTPALAQEGKKAPEKGMETSPAKGGAPARTLPIQRGGNGGGKERGKVEQITTKGTAVPTTAPTTDTSTLIVEENQVNLSAFSEPVQLSALVAMLADSLGINIAIKGDIPGTVVFNAPVSVHKDEFLALVDALLEQQGYAITPGAAGFYNVVPVADVVLNLEGERPSTRVIATPNLRPSALREAISVQLGQVAGQPVTGMSFIDELGVIVVTGTQRKLRVVDELVKQILAEYAKQEYLRIELNNIAAPVARQRALDLASGRSGGVATPPGQPINMAAAGGGVGGTLDNLGDRLTVDPQGNALIFKGVPAEIDQIRRLMAIIDSHSALQFKRYEVGTAAAQVADLARSRGLGDVTTIEGTISRSNSSGSRANTLQMAPQNPQISQQTTTLGGGSTMVVDETRGQILYYATEAQHRLMDSLIKELDIQAEEIVIRTYKIRHSKADEVAELILSVLRNEAPTGGGSSLLPQNRASRRSDSFGNNSGSRNGQGNAGNTSRGTSGASGGELTIDDSDAFVVADVKNNQIMVKAALRQQKDFERLIEKLDLRRPSVYIEATIVSVTWDDKMRLAFETQLINAAGKGGLLQTNFGLSTVGTATGILDPKVISPGLPGMTAALLRSDYVPIAINALQTEADAKVLSKPQLLVDDNENAEIVSLQQQATAAASTVVSGSQTTGGFGGYVDAGTTLNVTPQISGGGYLRLQYEVELSSFTGEGTRGDNPLPPPKLTNTVTSDSVTVPSDFTVVVGGLTVDSKTKTVLKVPFLGDIPIVGLLFQDRNTGERKTTLYVFLTPRVVRDPADIRLLSMQPKLDVGLPGEGLDLAPTLIESSLPDSMNK